MVKFSRFEKGKILTNQKKNLIIMSQVKSHSHIFPHTYLFDTNISAENV